MAEANHWKKRLDIPAYKVGDVARYAGTHPNTLRSWQRTRGSKLNALSSREPGDGFSYLELIEAGVVARMRQAGLKLSKIRSARSYLADEFGSKHPFAEYKFKTDGKHLLIDYNQISDNDRDKLMYAASGGQFAWRDILDSLLQEFEYDSSELVMKWKVAGKDSPIVIDPRIAFGSPSVDGVATWVIRERYKSGESIHDIADDLSVNEGLVREALNFEDIEIDPNREQNWFQ